MSIRNILKDTDYNASAKLKELEVEDLIFDGPLDVAELTADEIITDEIIGKSSSSVRITQIDSNSIDIANGTTLKIQQPAAFTLSDEYCAFTVNFAGINNTSGYLEPTSFTVENAGSSTYVPSHLSPFRMTVTETGFYLLSLSITNTTGPLVTNDGYEIKINDPTQARFIAGNSTLVGNGTAIGNYILQCAASELLNAGDVITFELGLSNGVSATLQNFQGHVHCTRIK